MSTSEDTRDRILQAAIGLLHERGVVAGVEHVKLSTACSRAGYTTGAGYRCWPTQEDFHRDLASTAIRWRSRRPISDVVAGIRPLIEAQAPLLEVIRTGAQAETAGRADTNVDYYVALALRASAMHDPSLMEASYDRIAETWGAWEALIHGLMKVYSRRMRMPFTVAHLVAALAALSEGFAIQHILSHHPHVERTDLPDGVESDWTLLGVTVQFLVEAFTEELDVSCAS